MDSAIIFSDILLVPHALGQNVKFLKNKGPVLSEFNYEIFKKIREKNLLKSYFSLQSDKDYEEKIKQEKILNIFCGSALDFICLYVWVEK